MDLEHARAEISAVGERIRNDGLPAALRPFVCGFAGYGQVSQGAQEIYDLLPIMEIGPSELGAIDSMGDACYKVVFREEHMVQRRDASSPFVLEEYFNHPDRYRAALFPYIEHLTLLVNGIFWTKEYPQFITRDQFRQLYEGNQPRLRVIGDITCDVDGALACTLRSTTPDSPIYVYDPIAHTTADGVAGHGPVVLAVDFLPCEVPVDASRFFSDALLPYIPGVAAADYTGSLADSGLPDELKRATMLWRGELTEPFTYLRQFLTQE
jgi:alpha-aminoadipic semialdehyde synthase